jgi:GR25 family glycosyltransferase involved in LPS biosynthesis
MPRIVYINLDSAKERREHMESQFAKYGITNYTRFSGLKANKSKHPKLKATEYGCIMSHLRIIQDFYTSGEDQLIIMEDDIDLLAVDNWDFTWKEVMDNIPEYDILQLVRNRDYQDHAMLKVWDWEDKSTAAYLITREYAKKILEVYKKDPVRLQMFEDLSSHFGPVADYALYKNFNSLSISIFKQVLFPSQISGPLTEWFIGQYEITEKFWSNRHKLEEVVGHIKK